MKTKIVIQFNKNRLVIQELDRKYKIQTWFYIYRVGTAVALWLRYFATNQWVAGSIPDDIMEFSIDINPSDRTIALGSTQPLTEMITRSISWG
jgi:hypothetical protein